MHIHTCTYINAHNLHSHIIHEHKHIHLDVYIPVIVYMERGGGLILSIDWVRVGDDNTNPLSKSIWEAGKGRCKVLPPTTKFNARAYTHTHT